MVTRTLLVVALAVAPIAWAAPIFDLNGDLCTTFFGSDYCDDEEETKESSNSDGLNVSNGVVIHVNTNTGTVVYSNGTSVTVPPNNGVSFSMTATMGGGTPASTSVVSSAATTPATGAPPAMPSVTPSAMPSATPSAMPSTTPSAMPG